ncbi:MAG: hypothetical protein ACJ8FT_06250 [Sphingomonas sp.]
MKKICALLTSVSLTACTTFGGPSAPPLADQPPIGATITVASAADARAAAKRVSTPGAQPQPQDVLLAACVPPKTHLFVGPIAISVVMLFFNLAVGAVDRYLKAKEAADLKTFSHGFTGNAIEENFPLAPTEQFSCIAIQEGQDSDYVLRLEQHGATAFVIEPVGAWVGSSGIQAKKVSGKVNTDLALALTTITQSGKTMPDNTAFAAFNMTFEDLPVGKDAEGHDQIKLVRYGDPHHSTVLPLPQKQVETTPTSAVVSVTQSDTNLDKIQERITLQQQTRAALFDTLGEILKGQLGG